MKKCTFPLLRMFMFVGMLPILQGSLSSCTPEQEEVDSHEAVDLGLSVKWASCTVGANSPEDYGGYYAWGETEKKGNYDWGTYKYRDDKDGDGVFDFGDGYQNIGFNISGTSYDVAHVKWGDGWRMPTLDEINELCEKCSRQWITVNGVSGQMVTGPNGNSIFLPATGEIYGTDVEYRGLVGIYRSGMLYEARNSEAYCICFDIDGLDWGSYVEFRDYGFTVRPVKD